MTGPLVPEYGADPELLEEVSGMNESELGLLREECQNDLFFLAKAILGYREVCVEAHGALCRFMTEESGQRRLILMPRGHFKSTICTVSDSIRLALIDPNTRILIINETATNAQGFLAEIKAHWEKNVLFRKLFSHLVPRKFVGPGSNWSQDMACITRTALHKEPTWSALGVGGAVVSRHFNRIKADDLIGEAAKESETVMAATITWNKSIRPLLTKHTVDTTDGIDWIGTRKGLYDLYSVIMDTEKRLKVFSREPIENNRPILESMFSMETFLEIMETTPDIWAADFMNNPMGKGMQDWGKQANRYYLLQGRRVFFTNKRGETNSWSIEELDKFSICDPNSGTPNAPDKAAVSTIGVSPGNSPDVFVLESWSGRPSPDGLLDQVFSQCDRWHPRVVGLEKAGQQNLKFHFEKRCRERSTFYRVEDLKPGNIDKEKRVRDALDTPIKEGRFYIEPTMLNLRNQLFRFPQLAKHNKDEIDTLGYIPQLQRYGISEVEIEKRRSIRKTVLSMRGRTGYGGGTRR